jgi:hypothetical protein
VSTFFLPLGTKTDTLYVFVLVSFFGSVVITMAQVLQGRHSYSFRISTEDLVNVHCKEAKHLNVSAAGLQRTPLMINRGSVFASEIMAVATTAPVPCFFRTPTTPKHMFYEQSHKLCSPRATRFKSGRRLACTPQPITYQAASDSSELQESADDQVCFIILCLLFVLFLPERNSPSGLFFPPVYVLIQNCKDEAKFTESIMLVSFR